MVINEGGTSKYTVYVTDRDNSVYGSGVLFYPGGDCIYVFTCAHVVDEVKESIRLYLLKPIDVSQDKYDVFCTDILKDQIVYSPIDSVKDGEHTEDFVIIPVHKPEGFEIEITDYFIGECSKNNPVYTQGYPNGVKKGANPIEYLDCLRGTIVVNISDSNRFTIRITEEFLDKGGRVYELKGMSGAPVWDGHAEDDSAVKTDGTLLGLISCGYDSYALLSKVFVVKAQQIRVLMREKFSVLIKRRLLDIPEEDVSGSDFKAIVFNGNISAEAKNDAEKWLEEKTIACKCCIDNLQLQKAIDIARETVADNRFMFCKKSSQKKLMQHLLYCYEIADLDEDFETLEADMVFRGLLKKYDALRHLTRSFMKHDYFETVTVAEEILNGKYYVVTEDSFEISANKTLIACARAFLLLSSTSNNN